MEVEPEMKGLAIRIARNSRVVRLLFRHDALFQIRTHRFPVVARQTSAVTAFQAFNG